MKTSLVFLLLFVGTVNPVDLKPFGSKYFEVIFDRFEVVYENKSIVDTRIKVVRVKKDRVFKGTAQYFEPLGNDVLVEVKALKKQGGEYRYLPYRIPKTPLCDGLKNDRYVYPDLVKGSDFPADVEKDCPFQGNYTIYNATTDLRNIPSIERVAQSGDYCVETIFYMNGQHFATNKIYLTVNNV